MLNININKRTLGVNFDDDKALVKVWSPLSDNVEVVLQNKKTIALHKDEFGYWETHTNEIKKGELYKFILNKKKELPDPCSLSQPQGVHGFSEAVDLNNFNWNDTAWENHDLEKYILYELHTGTFTPDGTFEGIEQKLQYLKSLGVNAIEIMPVAQFPGNRNWGYDGVYPFAVQDSYGGAQGLKTLVNACHNAGIAVVLDVVYNHLGPEGNYLGEYGPYFTGKYNTPWGNALNFDDAYCDGVREYFIENVLMRFRDFHIDALRLDAVHAIKDFSAIHILKEIKIHVDELMKATGKKHYLIVELDLNDNRFIKPLEKEGFGMDAQWIDEFHHALRITAGEEPSGYYSDFTGIEHLAKSYKDAYVYDGQYSPHRKKNFGIKAEENEGKQFIVFSQNHDQVGNRMLGERTSQLVSFEMQKLMAGAVIVAPFLPMLFMGEEWSEKAPFQYFVSHTDPDLAEAVRKGRKEEFAAFHAHGEAPDPMDEKTFLNSKLQWDLLQEEPHKTMFDYYRTLIDIRKKHEALHVLDRKTLEVKENKENNTLMLHRWYENKKVLCLMNFSKVVQEINLINDDKKWKKILDSADPIWGGPLSSSDNIKEETKIIVQPESILIYTNNV